MVPPIEQDEPEEVRRSYQRAHAILEFASCFDLSEEDDLSPPLVGGGGRHSCSGPLPSSASMETTTMPISSATL